MNLDLWVKSYEANPDPNHLYTTQINSTKELLDRCSKIIKGGSGEEKGSYSLSTVDKVSNRLKDIMKNIKIVNEKQKVDMQESLNISKEKNEIIQKKMIRIFAKYERLMHLQGRANSYDT